MEIEAKYAVIGPLELDQVSTLDLGAYSVTPAGAERHLDEILDTPDRALTRAQQALRIRRKDGAAVITLKGPKTLSGSVHSREEIEAPLTEGPAEDRSQWPREIADRVASLAGGQPLGPLVLVDIERRLWDVCRDGRRIAEMALDEGSIYAGGRALPVCELEVELKDDGTQSDLDTVAERLERALPLHGEPRGKLERGLALLSAGALGKTALLDLGRSAISEQLARLRRALSRARSGDDPDGVHDTRVAVRRIRTILDVLAASATDEARRLERLRQRLKQPARRLGDVRDLDVLLQREETYAQSQPQHRDDLDLFHRTLRKRWRNARDRLDAYLDGGKLADVLDDLDAFVESRVPAAPNDTAVTVSASAGGVIWARYEHVLRLSQTASRGDLDTLHRLRIACKQLRYTLEMFEATLGPGASQVIQVLKRAQDELGELHDAVVERELLEPVMAKHREALGLLTYAGALTDERDHRVAAFEPFSAYLMEPAFRGQIADLLAVL